MSLLDPKYKDLLPWDEMSSAIKEFQGKDKLFWEAIKDLRITSQRDAQAIDSLATSVLELNKQIDLLQDSIASLLNQIKKHLAFHGIAGID